MDQHSSKLEQSIDPITGSDSSIGGLGVPEDIRYHLHVTLDGEEIPLPLEGSIRLNDASDYQILEKRAEAHVKAHFELNLAGKSLYFRNGDCTINGDNQDRHVHGLSSQEDWKEMCTVFTKFYTSNRHHHQQLAITRDYFSLLTRRIGDESFASSKRTEIWGLMKTAFDGRKYIPRADLVRLTSADMVREIILEDPVPGLDLTEQETFTREVSQHGRKLLAMFVYAQLKMRCLKMLLDQGNDDSTLSSKPLENRDCCHQKCGPNFENLVIHQDGFNAAEFSNLGEHKKLLRNTVLPIHYHPKGGHKDSLLDEELETRSEIEERTLDEEDDKSTQGALCGSGAFSKVYRVKLDPAHHNLSTDKNADFALKVFMDRPSRTGTSFSKELKILDELRKHSTDHVVLHLATWTQDGRYYMLFPYAQCNLRQYIRRVSFDKPTKGNILWFLSQLLGLASALRQIHNLSNSDNITAGSSPNLLAPSAGDLHKSGWHHDLKPDNIIYFRVLTRWEGEFHIADFGSGKVHTYRSGSVYTRSSNGTLTYEPPEAAKEGVFSRPYDVWSMGCVFLELLVWAVYDYTVAKKFAEERGGRRFPGSQTNFIDDDAFWQMNQDSNIVLREAVRGRIEMLRDEMRRRGLIYFERVLELVDRMLNIERQNRISALNSWETLERIWKQAEVDMRGLGDDALPAEVDVDHEKLSINYLP
ncbi:MAG: hypothetical protein Q9179_004701 [Wetmoreana sp. 5 TL-2023]